MAENNPNQTISHHLRPPLFAAGGSCLSVDGCWLLRVVRAEGWDDRGNFLKQDNSEIGCTEWPFHSWFLCSMWHCLKASDPWENLFHIRVDFINKVYRIVSMLCCHLSNFSSSRCHLGKPHSMLIPKKPLVIRWFCHEIAAIQSHLLAPLPILGLLLFLPHLQWPPPFESWPPTQSHPWVLESTSSKLLFVSILWPLLMHHERS